MIPQWVEKVLAKVDPAALADLVGAVDCLVVLGECVPQGIHRELSNRFKVPAYLARLILGAALYSRTPHAVRTQSVYAARKLLKAAQITIPAGWKTHHVWAPGYVEDPDWSSVRWRPRITPYGGLIEHKFRRPWRIGTRPFCNCPAPFDLSKAVGKDPQRPKRIQCDKCGVQIQVFTE